MKKAAQYRRGFCVAALLVAGTIFGALVDNVAPPTDTLAPWLSAPVPPPPKPAIPVVQPDSIQALPLYSIVQPVTVVFSGLLKVDGAPYPDGRVVLHLTSRGDERSFEGRSGPDGRYEFVLNLRKAPGEQISWELVGESGDFRRVAVRGLHIFLDKERRTLLHTPLVITP